MTHKKKNQTATHRLEDMVVSEISLVVSPANQREFVVVKSRGGPLSLPSEARSAFSEAVMDALEKLTAVTDALKTAAIDDTAVGGLPVVAGMLREAAQVLTRAASFADNRADESDDNTETAKAGRGNSYQWPDDLSAHVAEKVAKGEEPDPALALDDLSSFLDARMRSAQQRRVDTKVLSAEQLLGLDDLSGHITAKMRRGRTR